MCIYIYTYMYIYICIYIYVCTSTYICTYIDIGICHLLHPGFTGDRVFEVRVCVYSIWYI